MICFRHCEGEIRHNRSLVTSLWWNLVSSYKSRHVCTIVTKQPKMSHNCVPLVMIDFPSQNDIHQWGIPFHQEYPWVNELHHRTSRTTCHHPRWHMMWLHHTKWKPYMHFFALKQNIYSQDQDNSWNFKEGFAFSIPRYWRAIQPDQTKDQLKTY